MPHLPSRKRRVLLVVALLTATTACSPALDSPRSRAGHPGMGGAVNHAGACAVPTPPAASTVVTVVLSDMGMVADPTREAPVGAAMVLHATPATVPAGRVTFVALNHGRRTHELVVLTDGSASTAGTRPVGPGGRIDETGSLGEASADCAAGGGEGVPPGSASWFTVDLGPGSYELVCNLPNHYRDGMHQLVRVS